MDQLKSTRKVARHPRPKAKSPGRGGGIDMKSPGPGGGVDTVTTVLATARRAEGQTKLKP